MVVKTAPPVVQERAQLIVPYGVATVIVGMAVTQLVSFEALALNLASYGLMTQEAAVALAILLLALEIFSIPFLIRLWLSPLARVASAICSLLAPTAWLALLLSASTQGHQVMKTGILGDFVALPISPLLILGFATLLLASVWSFVILGGRTLLKRSRSS